MNLSESLNITTVVLSVITVYATYIQMRVSSAKIKLDLYNKRLKIYNATIDYYYSIYKETPELVAGHAFVFIKSLRESKFLFDESSGIYEALVKFKEDAEIATSIDRRKAEVNVTPSVEFRLHETLISIESKIEKYISFKSVDGWHFLNKKNTMRGCLIIISVFAINILNKAHASADYCFSLSAKECESVEAADATLKKRPDYCKPGFALAENPFNLSKVQVRICQVTYDREDKDKHKEGDALVEEARALIREDAMNHLNLIQNIQTGYSCGVMDEMMASVAVSRLSHYINMEINEVGLINDSKIRKEMAIKIDNALDRGKDMANSGACENMSPAYRARLLHTARSLNY
ncbi:hypothetical protein ACLKQF_10840 [Aeromonas salmonicida]|jgi:hypothetical protein